MADNAHNRKIRPAVRLPLWGLGLLLVVLLCLVVAGGVWVFRTTQSLASGWEVTQPDFAVEAGDLSAPAGGAQTNLADPVITSDTTLPEDIDTSSFQPWSGQERVSILLLGIDQRCDESGPTHTDTMMLVSIDPVAMSAVALSLPRDLWGEIPNFGVDRINQANFLGEVANYPGGGPTLAVETVEAMLGIPIQYYGAVNFDAFIEFVDLIGGIDVEVSEDIDDRRYPDRCYGYDPFTITAGEHHLNGEEALKYARTRATFGGDVDRAGRQQQVLMAVRDTILNVNMVPRLIVQAPQLWQSFQTNVRTNMTLDEAIQLALLAQDIPQENIRLAVIDYNYVYPETTPDGQQVLAPQREQIRVLRDELFAPSPIPAPVIEDLPQRAAQENARVAVLNGTATFGLAAATQEYLRQYNIDVVEIGNADASTYVTSRMVVYGSFPYTVSYLAQLLDIPPLNISDGAKPAGEYDILIILGNDWQLVTPTPTPSPS